MKYVVCLAILAVTACTPAAPYPTSYTAAPPPVMLGKTGKHICPLDGKNCCDMPCCKDGKCAECCKDGVCTMGCCKGDCCGKKKPAAVQPHHDHSSHSHGEVDIYAPIMADMHKAMGAYTPTGDADADFVQGMIPHHQGAVDMAYLVLEHGDDPYIRRLARDVIVAQRREIAFMQYWLRTRGQLPDSNISNVNVTN